ncbi:HNH endonuclease [Microbulbifer sp. JMSA008]|uniref:HNH endonuclease n=1 Tax=Microbulbifer sp. JMSA008 TaxID=3243373 RepID=UPI0040391443
MKLKCIYCGIAEFDKGKGSEEHAILSSLGGRKASRSICCQACNGKLGEEIDKPLVEGLRHLSTYFGVLTGRNKESAIVREFGTHNGVPFDLLPGGQVQLSKDRVEEEIDEDKGIINISVHARDEYRARNILKGLLRKHGKTEENLNLNEMARDLEGPGPVNSNLELGGELQYRSIAKSALTYLATMISSERLRGECFSEIIEYILGRREGARFVFIVKMDFPEFPSVSEVQHRIIIFASEGRRMVVGLLELFGGIRFKVTLSNCWDGPDVKKGYAVNPLTGEHKECEIEESINDDCWGEDLEVNSEEIFKEILNGVFVLAYRNHIELEKNRIFERVWEEFQSEISSQGLTSEIRQRVFFRLSEELARLNRRINKNFLN